MLSRAPLWLSTGLHTHALCEPPLTQTAISNIEQFVHLILLFWCTVTYIMDAGPSRATAGPGIAFSQGPIAILFRLKHPANFRLGKLPMPSPLSTGLSFATRRLEARGAVKRRWRES